MFHSTNLQSSALDDHGLRCIIGVQVVHFESVLLKEEMKYKEVVDERQRRVG